MYTYYYPTEFTQGKKCVMDCLDRFLYKSEKPITRYYCPFTGKNLSCETYKLALEYAKSNKYETTDHAPIELQVDGLRCLYVSLDNSVRANMNGFSLVASGRLDRICNLVKTINPDIVFFSEACRKSFEGSMDEQKNPVYWMDMRQTISKFTGMVHCCECTNNFDEKQMSFGVAMFAKQEVLQHIQSVQACQFLPMDLKNECYGSGAVVMTTKSGKTVVAVHFPLDFKRKSGDNNNGKALKALIDLLNKYPNSYGFGDMNVIKGNIWNSMSDVINETEWKISEPYYTYIGAFYDYGMFIKEQTYQELTIEEINNGIPIPAAF
jgi:hypothetical protein